ncbi:MAG: hypothetical protein Q7K45_07275, partial [Nanoarchaeota archaeon]|nr:hypothetical protein [Nanoarchaeota archaeon]
KNTMARLNDIVQRLKRYDGNGATSIKPLLENTESDFEKAMDDDLEVVRALAVMFEFIRDANRAMDEKTLSKEDAKQALTLIENIDSVLAVLIADETIDTGIQELLTKREQARKDKDWAMSDQIRDVLASKGIILEDTPSGTIWKKAL